MYNDFDTFPHLLTPSTPAPAAHAHLFTCCCLCYHIVVSWYVDTLLSYHHMRIRWCVGVFVYLGVCDPFTAASRQHWSGIPLLYWDWVSLSLGGCSL